MSRGTPATAASRGPFRTALSLAVAAAAVYLLAASSRDFWYPDEPDFAEHVREMLERKDLLVPYQNGTPYSEKPILYYWAMAATTPFSGGDVHPAALRLPSILSAAFLVFGAAALAGWRGGRTEALVAGAGTAVAPIVFWQGQFIQTDALFSALLFGALSAQLLVEEDPIRRERWVWAFQVLLPLAVLTKGPLAVAVAGLVALARCGLRRSWEPLLWLRPFRGALVFVLVVVPWYVAATRAGGPAYTYDLVVNQNWNRFFHAFDHVQPWWFYLESVWGDFLPLTPLALAAPFVFRGSDVLARRGELRHAALVAAVVFLFLSSSGSKQGKYLLVAYPFAAVLAAAAVAEVERRASTGLRWLRSYVLLLSGILLGAALALTPVARRRVPGFARLAPLVAAPLGIGAVGVGFVLYRRGREAAPALLALCATLAAGEAAAALAVFPAIDVQKTGRPFYERIKPRVAEAAPLAWYGGTYHCYPILMLRRRTEHFSTEAELLTWVERTPKALVLIDRSERRSWTNPSLLALPILDRQRTGQDEILLLGRP